MARSYPTNGDKIRTSAGNAAGITTAVTLAAILKTDASRDLAWRNVISALTAGGVGTAGYGVEIDNTNTVRLNVNGAAVGGSTFTVASADGWVLIVVTKAAGTVLTRYHLYKYSTAVFTHQNAGVTSADSASAGGLVEIGGDFGGALDYYRGDIALAGMWNRALSDVEVENLPFTLTSWYSLAPSGLWMLDQDKTTHKVVDLSGGGANESAITGTAISTASVPVFNYNDGVWVPTIVKPGGVTTYQKAGSVLSSMLGSGADSFNSAETGSLTTQRLLSGADATTRSEAGSLLSGMLSSGADSFNPSEAGSLLTAALLSGPDSFNPSETGALLAAVLLAGADARTAAETGSLLSNPILSGTNVKTGSGKTGALLASALLSGTDSAQRAETGAVLSSLLLSGADAATFGETGFVTLQSLLSGPDASAFAEAGSLIASALVSAARLREKSKTGSVLASGLLSGADAATYTETGALLAAVFGSGADSHISVKSGAVFAAGQLYGADVFIATETGALLAVGQLSGLKSKQHAATGSLVSRIILSGIQQVLSGYQMHGNEIHLLTSAKVEQGILTAAGPEDAVLVITIPGSATLTKVDN